MGSLHEIECLLDIEIGDRKLNPGKKKPNKNRYYYYSDRYYIIELTQDKWMICSDNRETRVLLRNHCWFYAQDYARAKIDGINNAYHQAYLNYDAPLVCDHINRHTFDNRFDNLRIVTRQENGRNRNTLSNNTSGKQGVFLWTDTNGSIYWIARINVGGGRRVRRCFGINKYGNDEAYRRAVQCRKDLEQQYNYIGE